MTAQEFWREVLTAWRWDYRDLPRLDALKLLLKDDEAKK